jgi:hypothetical protein
MIVPIGKNNIDLNTTGTSYKDGTPITIPHEFDTPISLPHDFGNDIPVSDPTLNSNPVTWATPDTAHFGSNNPAGASAFLTIVNNGFESDILPTTLFTDNSFAAGWVGDDDGGGPNSFGAWNIAINGTFVAPQGLNVGYLASGAGNTVSIQQTLVDTWLPTSLYTISFYTDSNATSFGKVQLLSGVTVVFDSGDLTANISPFSVWTLESFTFSAALATLGQPIIIKFLASDENEMEVDEVSLAVIG